MYKKIDLQKNYDNLYNAFTRNANQYVKIHLYMDELIIQTSFFVYKVYNSSYRIFLPFIIKYIYRKTFNTFFSLIFSYVKFRNTFNSSSAIIKNALTSNVSLDKVNTLLESRLNSTENQNKELMNSLTVKHKEIIHSFGFCICFLICCEIFLNQYEKSFTNSISFFPNEFISLFKKFCEDFKSVIFPSDENHIIWKNYPSEVSSFFVIIFDYYDFKYTSAKIKEFNSSLYSKLDKLTQKIHKKDKQEISYSVIPTTNQNKKEKLKTKNKKTKNKKTKNKKTKNKNKTKKLKTKTKQKN